MRGAALAAGLLAIAGCGAERLGTVEVRIPDGANVRAIADTLQRAGLIGQPHLFRLYVRMRGTARQLKSGRYRFPAAASWDEILADLERGAVVTVPVTIPEGFRLDEIARRLAAVTATPSDSILRLAEDGATARRLGVPGPTLEGYLFPDTYHLSEGIDPRSALETMAQRYRDFWGEQQRRQAEALGLDEREVVTLASIVEAEARMPEERPVIAGVYLNRIERGMLLQADPTVQYALGEPREPLLYRDIEAVADDPYNTYAHPGLPPGPIGSPGAASLRAVLEPADVPYLFFVARPDGSHVFTETERQHINAKNRIRRGREAAAADRSGDGGASSERKKRKDASAAPGARSSGDPPQAASGALP